jgi:hypothetical protein
MRIMFPALGLVHETGLSARLYVVAVAVPMAAPLMYSAVALTVPAPCEPPVAAPTTTPPSLKV